MRSVPPRAEGNAKTAPPAAYRSRFFPASLFRVREPGRLRAAARDGGPPQRTPWPGALLLFLLTALLGASPGRAQSPVGEVFASDASIKGSMVLAAGGMEVMSGSTVAAGA